ncbi:MAG: TIGR01777 family oxidoreductase [Bdellovibrionaceae bacterium]|nr:TIGR01777 family oxidoreductase [Pseudobdellovibrionaceae bacterium]MDW8190176.1 TIGR01777 family oxidoreductase [Pseudobdellovibrionaceae bacterium]
MKVLITGATGMIGCYVGKLLHQSGHDLVVISRRSPNDTQMHVPFPCDVITADLGQSPIRNSLLEEVEYIINLTGESIVGSLWTPSYKRRLEASRVVTTRNLFQSFALLSKRNLKGYIGASAIGFYGNSFQEQDEQAEASDGFLSQLVQKWEDSHMLFKDLLPQQRVAVLRLGVVLGYPGGIHERVIPLLKMGLGSVLGSGKQWMSWVDLRDVGRFVLWLLERTSPWSPIYNVTSPNPVTHCQWLEQLTQSVRGRMIPFNTPSWFLKAILREQSELLLGSQRVLPQRALAEGFRFHYERLEQSLAFLNELFAQTTHLFWAEQFLPKKKEEVFPFFQNAKNLEQITPDFLHFKILKQSTALIQEGTEFHYTITLFGIPLKWKTLILDWDPPHRFSDLQVQGPYKRWYHQHIFNEVPGGVIMNDRVFYELPLEPVGHIGYPWVRQTINKIFQFRRRKIFELFADDHTPVDLGKMRQKGL